VACLRIDLRPPGKPGPAGSEQLALSTSAATSAGVIDSALRRPSYRCGEVALEREGVRELTRDVTIRGARVITRVPPPLQDRSRSPTSGRPRPRAPISQRGQAGPRCVRPGSRSHVQAPYRRGGPSAGRLSWRRTHRRRAGRRSGGSPARTGHCRSLPGTQLLRGELAVGRPSGRPRSRVSLCVIEDLVRAGEHAGDVRADGDDMTADRLGVQHVVEGRSGRAPRPGCTRGGRRCPPSPPR